MYGNNKYCTLLFYVLFSFPFPFVSFYRSPVADCISSTGNIHERSIDASQRVRVSITRRSTCVDSELCIYQTSIEKPLHREREGGEGERKRKEEGESDGERERKSEWEEKSGREEERGKERGRGRERKNKRKIARRNRGGENSQFQITIQSIKPTYPVSSFSFWTRV